MAIFNSYVSLPESIKGVPIDFPIELRVTPRGPQSFATFSTWSSHYHYHLDLTWFDSKSQTLLVGGFNPSEKYGSQLGWNSQYIMGKYTPNIPNHINHQPETYVQLCSIIPFNYDGCGIPPTRQNLKLWVSKPPTSINK